MDKKLSDNEIVKALDNDCLCVVYGVDCESCPLREKDCKILPEAIKDLIHRLQADNIQLKWNYVDLKERYVKVLDLNEKVIAEQKTEIERLTEENRQLVKIGNGFALERNNLREELDELKKSGNGVLLTSLYKKQADDHKRGLSVQRAYWEKQVQQAVKDTAKEICDLILEHWEKKQFVECDWLRVAIAEKYGVDLGE